jgi:hypothetical protein
MVLSDAMMTFQAKEVEKMGESRSHGFFIDSLCIGVDRRVDSKQYCSGSD